MPCHSDYPTASEIALHELRPKYLAAIEELDIVTMFLCDSCKEFQAMGKFPNDEVEAWWVEHQKSSGHKP